MSNDAILLAQPITRSILMLVADREVKLECSSRYKPTSVHHKRAIEQVKAYDHAFWTMCKGVAQATPDGLHWTDWRRVFEDLWRRLLARVREQNLEVAYGTQLARARIEAEKGNLSWLLK